MNDFEAIRARAEKATPGPWIKFDASDSNDVPWWWVWQESKLPYYGGVFEPDSDYTIKSHDDGRLYHVSGAVGVSCVTDNKDLEQEEWDAEFIAHAREDIPALLAMRDAVLAMHPEGGEWSQWWPPGPEARDVRRSVGCQTCRTDGPCETRKALGG